MNKKLAREFNFWRILGILALICTIFMVCLLCYEALKPGEASSDTSGDVEDTIKDIIPDIPDNDQNYELVSVRCKQSGSSRPVGEKLQLTFAYTPQQATNKELTFVSSNPQFVSVDEQGVVTFHAYGETKITATSTANPSVKTSFKLICNGVPAGDISNIYPTFDDKDGAAPKYEVPEGTYSYIGFRDDAGQIISITTLSVECHNTDVLRMSDTKHFVAIKPGTAKITVTNKSTKQTKDILITVTESDTFVAPEYFEFAEHVLYVDKNTSFDPRDNISHVLPDGATFDKRFCQISCSNTSLFDIAVDTYTAVELGDAYFVITSYATGDVSMYRVVVVEPTPDQLSIIGNDRIVRDKEYSYTAFDGERDCDRVTWSVVKGGATITEDGTLVATKLGNVVIRATSTQDESIYVDMKVRVSMFEDFHAFVRKIFGHFSAFAILGVGFAVTFFLLCRPRKLSALFALLCSVSVAALTEIFQMPIFTANRGPSVKDVLLDSAGSLCGVVVTMLLILLFFLITKSVSRKKYQQTKLCLDKLSFKTMFTPAKKLFANLPDDTTTTVAENPKQANKKRKR